MRSSRLEAQMTLWVVVGMVRELVDGVVRFEVIVVFGDRVEIVQFVEYV